MDGGMERGREGGRGEWFARIRKSDGRRRGEGGREGERAAKGYVKASASAW